MHAIKDGIGRHFLSTGRVYHTDELSVMIDDLKKGACIAYPSESVWGVGCDGFNDEALNQIIQLKNRADDKGLITLTDRADRLLPLLPNEQAAAIIARIGSVNADTMQQQGRAVTWLIPIDMSAAARLGLPKLLTGQHQSLAVRVTPHPLLAPICKGLVSATNPCGLLVSTSCNPSGEAPATDLTQAQTFFGDTLNYLAADSLGFSKPSQIIDALTGGVLR